MKGMNATTGREFVDLPPLYQSIVKILATPLASKRFELYLLDYTAAPLRRNAKGRYGGQYTRGSIEA